MPVFVDFRFSEFTVAVRPRDRFRKWLRYRHWYLLPYLDGEPLWLRLKIEANPSSPLVASQQVTYAWRFRRLSDGRLLGHDARTVKVAPGSLYRTDIASVRILEPARCVLEVKLDKVGQRRDSGFRVAALFAVQDREIFYLQFLWFIIGAIVGALLGFFG